MERLYFIEYVYYSGSVGRYTLDSKGNSPKGELKVETYTRKERDLWISRYKKLKSSISDIHYDKINLFTTKSLSSGVITLITDEQMNDIINGI